jgi:hypothetical protein
MRGLNLSHALECRLTRVPAVSDGTHCDDRLFSVTSG